MRDRHPRAFVGARLAGDARTSAQATPSLFRHPRVARKTGSYKGGVGGVAGGSGIGGTAPGGTQIAMP